MNQRPPLAGLLLHLNEGSQSEANTYQGLGATVSWSRENLGFSGAHNRLLMRAFAEGADAAIVLNPDLTLASDASALLWLGATTGGTQSLVGPLLEWGDDRLAPTGLIDSAGIRWTRSGRHVDAFQGQPLDAAPTGLQRVEGLTGACLLVTRQVHDLVVARCGEFFDEDFVAYREDAELGLRLKALGIDSVLVPEARGVHRRRLRGTTRSVGADVNRLGVQNRLLLRFKHGRGRPGNPILATLRDCMVVLAAATVERSSWPGVRNALVLRKLMRRKRDGWTEA